MRVVRVKKREKDDEIYAKSAFFYLFVDIMLSPILLREN